MADRNIQAIYPLTAMQEGILFHTLESPRSGTYFNQFSCRIEGLIDRDRFRRAWKAAFEKHAVLRTLFTWDKRERPLQIVRQRVDVPFRAIDWQGNDSGDLEARLEAFLEADRQQGFELDVAPLSRIALIQLDTNVVQVVWSFHHIVLDGWSVRLVFDEVMEDYRHARDGAASTDAAPSFETFVSWQKNREQSNDEAFWRARLEGFSVPTTPEIRLRGGGQDLRDGRPGEQTKLVLSRQQSAALVALAREQRVTLNTVVVAAWSILLSRYCDSRDVVFGTTVAGRTAELAGVERIVGLLINTLPLRIRLDPGLKVADLLRDVQRQQVELQPFEQTSLQQIRRFSQVAASMPLFETIVVFENLPASEGFMADELRVTGKRFIEHSNFPLALLAVPGDELEFICVHDGARYSPPAVQQLLDSLVYVLEQLSRNEAPLLQDYSAVTPAARERLLRTSRGPELAMEAGQESILQLIERRVDESPTAIALAAGREEETYESLNAKANRLARRLIDKHDAPRVPVVIYASRSVDAIVAMLGVLKSGAAYVPTDVNDPGTRLRQVAADLARRFPAGGAVRPLVLTQANYLDDMPTDIADIALIEDGQTSADSSNVGAEIRANDLAYVIYTSGSTGAPKGVMVRHGALLNSNLARFEYYDDQPESFALVSSLATDSSLAGIYWTLCAGGKLVITPPRVELDIEQVSELIRTNGVSHLLCVPSLYSLILENASLRTLECLRVVIVAGESCNESLVMRHYELLPDTALHNEYGPSEACVWATAAKLDAGPVSIGRPIASTMTYVLDEGQQIVPPGVAGELYIGGRNVALGYLGQPLSTSSAFVADPFAADGSRMYRTGDRVRLWEDGRLEFLGRSDHQLKVRGFRIEPGEVEAAVVAHPDVDEAVVYKRTSTSGDQLVAVVAGSIAESADLREFCAQLLPQQMVPQQIAVIDRLPRTPAGKIDRNAIISAEMFADARPVDSGVGPRTPNEEKLAEIWRDVIGLDEIYVYDNFFEIGGDSLMTIRILSRASREGMRIDPEQFLDNPTIAAQAVLVDESHASDDAEDDSAGPVPLLPIQRWFFNNILTDPQHWNFSYLFDIDATVTTQHLNRALASLLHRHAALRTKFTLVDTGWTAEVVDEATATVETVDVGASALESGHKVIEEVARRLNSSFELSQAPLLRACRFRSGAKCGDRLLLVIHHLVVDTESWRLLIADLAALLRQDTEYQTPESGERSSSVVRWARQLSNLAGAADLDADRAYWNSELADGVPSLPTDNDRSLSSNLERDALIRSYVVDREWVDALQESARESLRASMYQVVLSALARTIACETGESRVVFDTEGHGREPLLQGFDVAAVVGWLTTVFPLVFDAEAATWDDPIAALRHVKERLSKLPRNGITFGILRDLADSGDGRDNIAAYDGADVLFNYLGEVAIRSEDGAILTLVDTRCGLARSPECERAYLLEVNAYLAHDELVFDISSNSQFFAGDSIDKLGFALVRAIGDLADAAAGSSADATVGADFALADLSTEELENVAAQLNALDE